MSYEDGLALINRIGNVEVLWISTNGEMKMSEGLSSLVMEE